MKSIYFLLLFCVVLTQISLAQIPPDRDYLLNGIENEPQGYLVLTNYPSPKSVLDISGALNLTNDQRASINTIYEQTLTRAKELGKQIVMIEEELYNALRSGLVNEKSINDDTQQIGRLRGRLRGVFLNARLKTKKILSSNQLDLYSKLIKQKKENELR